MTTKIQTSGLENGSVTYDKLNANTAHLDRAGTFTAPQRGTITDLGVASANTTLDLNTSNFYQMTVNASMTMLNPSNIASAVGQAGSIVMVSNGAFTVSWGSYWRFPDGVAPTLSTIAGKIDRVDYFVQSSNTIHTIATTDLLGTA